MGSKTYPRLIRRTARTFVRAPSPVHSAHVGQELEVHYRCHPHYGRKVLVRRVEQRATGQFLKVQGPTGIVISIAGWMLDPVICAEMTVGAPRVDLAALIELRRLLMGVSNPTHSRIDVGIVREKGNAVSQVAGSCAGPADEPVIRRQQAGRVGRRRAEQGYIGTGSDPHAGGGRPRRGT
jgi:hypothetical protein